MRIFFVISMEGKVEKTTPHGLHRGESLDNIYSFNVKL